MQENYYGETTNMQLNQLSVHVKGNTILLTHLFLLKFQTNTATDWCCLDSLVLTGELVCSKEQRKKLIKISPATIDRLLKEHKKRPVGKGKSYTKPGTLLKTQIPVRTFADWDGGEDRILCN